MKNTHRGDAALVDLICQIDRMHAAWSHVQDERDFERTIDAELVETLRSSEVA